MSTALEKLEKQIRTYVQVVMEKLGGGGHMNIAGTQLKDITIEDAKTALIRVLREMKDKGEL